MHLKLMFDISDNRIILAKLMRKSTKKKKSIE